MKTVIEGILQNEFEPHYLDVIDESHNHIGHAGAKEGGHFQVLIVSEAFHGKSLLERHRMVYEALKPIKTSIHALSIYAKTPAEF